MPLNRTLPTAAHFMGLSLASSSPPQQSKNIAAPATRRRPADVRAIAVPTLTERDALMKAAVIEDPMHREMAVIEVLNRGMLNSRTIGRTAERLRCASIFGDPNAAKNVELAAHLAFNTNTDASDAAALMASPEIGGTWIRHRSSQQSAASWDDALMAARKPG